MKIWSVGSQWVFEFFLIQFDRVLEEEPNFHPETSLGRICRVFHGNFCVQVTTPLFFGIFFFEKLDIDPSFNPNPGSFRPKFFSDFRRPQGLFLTNFRSFDSINWVRSTRKKRQLFSDKLGHGKCKIDWKRSIWRLKKKMVNFHVSKTTSFFSCRSHAVDGIKWPKVCQKEA